MEKMEESEEDISQHLADLGLLEEGMTEADKQSLWAVIKLSKDTAEEEEHNRQENRKSLQQISKPTTSFGAKQNNPDEENSMAGNSGQLMFSVVDDISCNSVNSNDVDNLIVPGMRTVNITNANSLPVSFPAQSQSYANVLRKQTSPASKSPSSEQDSAEIVYTTQVPSNSKLGLIDLENSLEKSGNLHDKSSHQSTQKSLQTKTSVQIEHKQMAENTDSDEEDSPQLMIQNRTESVHNVSENESADDFDDDSCDVVDITRSETEVHRTVPFTSNKFSLTLLKPENKDKKVYKRDIDAFNCDRSNYHITLKIWKKRRVRVRQPFNIPPRNMDIETYVEYFKYHVDYYNARSKELQPKVKNVANVRTVPDKFTVDEPKELGKASKEYFRRFGEGLKEQGKKLRNILKKLEADLREQKKRQKEILRRYQKKQERHVDVESDDEDIACSKGRDSAQRDSPEVLFDSFNIIAPSPDVLSIAGPSNTSLRNEKTVTMKRKSESDDDSIFGDEFQEPEEKKAANNLSWPSISTNDLTSNKRKKLYPGKSAVVAKDAGFIPVKSSRQRRKKGRRKVPQSDVKILKESILEDDVIMDEIKPAPIRLRNRGKERVLQHIQKEVEGENRGQDDEISVVFTSPGSSKTGGTAKINKVTCPICRKWFRAEDIEEHASECTEFVEDDSGDISFTETFPKKPDSGVARRVCQHCGEEKQDLEVHIKECIIPKLRERDVTATLTQPRAGHSPSSSADPGQSHGSAEEEGECPGKRFSVFYKLSEDELDSPPSPVRCFVPISAQTNSHIDYHNQFPTADTQRTKRRPRKRKRKQRTKKSLAKKQKQASDNINSTKLPITTMKKLMAI